MNLIERARAWDDGVYRPKETSNMLHELAGEVERLWTYELDMKGLVLPEFERSLVALREGLAKVTAESAAEIARIRSETDTAAVRAAWFDGYRAAASVFNGIVADLLGALGNADKEARHDH